MVQKRKNICVHLETITPDAEKAIEMAGRTLYDSCDKITDNSSSRFIHNIINNGHLNIIEHASATFKIKNVSRSLMAQLTKHRLSSLRIRSLRYADGSILDYVIPKIILYNKDAISIVTDLMEHVYTTYKTLRSLDVSKEDCRCILPLTTITEIIISANFYEWLHFIKLTISPKTQWEIKQLAETIQDILSKHAPNIFQKNIINNE